MTTSTSIKEKNRSLVEIKITKETISFEAIQLGRSWSSNCACEHVSVHIAFWDMLRKYTALGDLLGPQFIPQNLPWPPESPILGLIVSPKLASVCSKFSVCPWSSPSPSPSPNYGSSFFFVGRRGVS